MAKTILIIGASGHGKVVADIARKNGYDEILFLDDNKLLNKCGGYRVVGTSEAIVNYNCDVIVAIGNADARQRLLDKVDVAGMNSPVIIHPNASIAENVEIGKGTVIAAGAVINPGTKIGKGCIINTCASVDHDCTVGDFSHVSVGAHVAGSVNIGSHTWIGAGATVSNNIKICDECMIGTGAVVIKDITESGTYIGIPAMRIR